MSDLGKRSINGGHAASGLRATPTHFPTTTTLSPSRLLPTCSVVRYRLKAPQRPCATTVTNTRSSRTSDDTSFSRQCGRSDVRSGFSLGHTIIAARLVVLGQRHLGIPIPGTLVPLCARCESFLKPLGSGVVDPRAHQQCGQRPVYKGHQFCGKNCANTWQAANGSSNGPTSNNQQYGQQPSSWHAGPPQSKYPSNNPTQPFQALGQNGSREFLRRHPPDLSKNLNGGT